MVNVVNSMHVSDLLIMGGFAVSLLKDVIYMVSLYYILKDVARL
jgi:hypothetical protein